MIRDTVMNHNDYDPLTDVLIGEAVLSLLKSKGPISKQALIGKLQAMQAGEQDNKRRNAIGRIIDEISNMVARRGNNKTVVLQALNTIGISRIHY